MNIIVIITSRVLTLYIHRIVGTDSLEISDLSNAARKQAQHTQKATSSLQPSSNREYQDGTVRARCGLHAAHVSVSVDTFTSEYKHVIRPETWSYKFVQFGYKSTVFVDCNCNCIYNASVDTKVRMIFYGGHPAKY